MKKAFVTGASEGIGRAFCVELARQGWQVTAVARNEERLKSLLVEIGSYHEVKVADLNEPGALEDLKKTFQKTHYDLVINNAGFGIYGTFHELTESQIHSLITTNIVALTELAHAYLKTAISGDTLINVSSTLAFLPLPKSGTYSATKAYVTSLTESLWYENKDRDVYVFDLCPGLTRTQFQSRAGRAAPFYPKLMTENAEDVVASALSAMKARRAPTVVSGFHNRMLTLVSRFLSRKTVVSTMGKRNSPVLASR